MVQDTFNLIYIVFAELRAMAERFKSVFKQVARVGGKTAVWTGAAVAGLRVMAKAGEMEEEAERQRPPIIR